MTATTTGWDHTILVHLERLRSPLGVVLLIAAFSLLLALLLIRQRRQRDLASVRGRTAVLSTYTASARRRHALEEAQNENKSVTAQVGEFVRRRRPPNLSEILGAYSILPVEGQQNTDDAGTLLTLPVLKRLSVTLESYLGDTRVGRWLTMMLDRSGIRAKLGELLVIWLIAGLALILLAWVLAGVLGIFIVLILLVVVPPAALQGAVDHRAKLFASQLPDALKLTASSLRAGFSLLQGLEAVTKQLREPSAGELQRVLTEARLGRPVEEALEGAAARIRNRDFSESVAAVRIQQEAGGNLAALFDTLAETMVQRLRLRREVHTLTAEGRLSAYILGLMPLLLGILIFTINRAYMEVLFQTFAGKVMLIGGLLLQIVGFYWMYRIVDIET
jgi:Flp pilus assembly protein TadB